MGQYINVNGMYYIQVSITHTILQSIHQKLHVAEKIKSVIYEIFQVLYVELKLILPITGNVGHFNIICKQEL